MQCVALHGPLRGKVDVGDVLVSMSLEEVAKLAGSERNRRIKFVKGRAGEGGKPSSRPSFAMADQFLARIPRAEEVRGEEARGTREEEVDVSIERLRARPPAIESKDGTNGRTKEGRKEAHSIRCELR